jgi:hypothetical protein
MNMLGALDKLFREHYQESGSLDDLTAEECRSLSAKLARLAMDINPGSAAQMAWAAMLLARAEQSRRVGKDE